MLSGSEQEVSRVSVSVVFRRQDDGAKHAGVVPKAEELDGRIPGRVLNGPRNNGVDRNASTRLTQLTIPPAASTALDGKQEVLYPLKEIGLPCHRASIARKMRQLNEVAQALWKLPVLPPWG